MRQTMLVLFIVALVNLTLAGCGQGENETSILPSLAATSTRMGTSITTATSTSVRTPIPAPTVQIQPTDSPVFLKSLLEAAFTEEDCLLAGVPEPACTGVVTNDEWQVVSREFEGVEMVLVPAGCFLMGSEDGFLEEQPVHEVCIHTPFWIDRTEVTVSQFADFLNGQPEPVESYDRWLSHVGPPDLVHFQLAYEEGIWVPLGGMALRPLEHTVWIGASSYCTWRGVRLPTEAEWEYAARGPDHLMYPWGNEVVKDNIVIYRGENPDVGSKPQGASWVGALDMSGSVFEWTSSIFLPYPYDPEGGREATLEEDLVSSRVFRGSPWYHNPTQQFDHISMTARFNAPPDFANWYFGFRCARSFGCDAADSDCLP
ncbi:MAG TPA: SUMF1/EgtB/PvdO family nonheme iron enzyme [Anaerolineales bacterium]|jgi:formylglycine-generating enzyme required for sulfatase activity|nr:SUMF1/EgtB/PvdO family nonheme iron enzyme [Anaerolineales bacterium]